MEDPYRRRRSSIYKYNNPENFSQSRKTNLYFPTSRGVNKIVLFAYTQLVILDSGFDSSWIAGTKKPHPFG